MKNRQTSGWLLPHQCVQKPHTAYEIAKVMRVREMKQTATSSSRKYFNIDTLTFDSERLETIKSYSISEYVVDEYGSQDVRHPSFRIPRHNKPWFEPRDDDFDEECRRDEEEKKRNEELKRKARERYELEKYQQQKQEEKKREREHQEKIKQYWIARDREIAAYEAQEKEGIKRYEEEERERQILASTPMHFVYHPDFPAKIVPTDEYNRLINDGWYDTPTKFPKREINFTE